MGHLNQIAFVVTCKGRLHHLSQSLPLLARQPDSECIVVDYDCPDQSHLWVAAHFPDVRVIRVKDSPVFNLSRARNLGAQAATAPWLCFVDADILVAEGFAAALRPLLCEGFHYRPQPSSWDQCGTHLCTHADFDRIGGYDEVLAGWGGEDRDVYHRLEGHGCRPAPFPGSLISSLPHGDEDRTRYYDIRDRWINQRVNVIYLQVKYDLARQLGTPALAQEARQTIYAEVRRTVLQDAARGVATSRFEVTLPESTETRLMPGWTMRRRLVYEMAPLPGAMRAGLPPPKPAGDYLASHSTCKLHIGCGDHLLEGWLNTDLRPRVPGVLPLDATRPLPFPDGSFDYIFSEHLIEHMPYPQGCKLLAECRRVLKPGGTIRVATLDFAFLAALYNPENTALQQAYLDWSKQRHLPWAPSAEDIYVINNSVRDWGHQFIYDDKAMRHALVAAGFSGLVRCPIMKSRIEDLCGLENEARTPPGLLALETMVFEAIRD
jgi:predicted SAM-dependent methyltransferase